jgi:hypothetical protein
MKAFAPFALACSLGLALSLPAAHAGEPMDPSERSVLYLSVGLATPLMLSMSASTALSDSSAAADRKQGAATLPPMQVTAIRTTADGGREVELVAHHEGKDETSVLRWPRREDDPAAAFRVGQTVTFKPSTDGGGWMVQDDAGAQLAFVPTVETAGQAASKAW